MQVASLHFALSFPIWIFIKYSTRQEKILSEFKQDYNTWQKNMESPVLEDAHSVV